MKKISEAWVEDDGRTLTEFEILIEDRVEVP